jgi:ketosteroid isomerase-like protein
MDEHPNVALIRTAFEHLTAGDVQGVISLWDADLSYYAFDPSGEPVSCRGRDEFVELVWSGRALFSEHVNTAMDIRAVGDELVVAVVRSQSKAASTGEALEADFLMVFRIEDGRIVMGCDFIDGTIQAFMERAWS